MKTTMKATPAQESQQGITPRSPPPPHRLATPPETVCHIHLRRSGCTLRAMGFACPHFEPNTDSCLSVRRECVPGRPGGAIAQTTSFAVPWEKRLEEQLNEKRRANQVLKTTKDRYNFITIRE